MQRPDLQKELSRLKDFQKATVERAFQRMYLDKDHTRRFLVADEVGLGKTLVAKGLIARVVDHLWESVERIDVVYVCSNINIARQNRNRLQLHGKKDSVIEARITLLPLHSAQLSKNKLNMILLTPGTSLDLGKTAGTVQERALLQYLLEKQYDINPKSYVHLFRANANADTLRCELDKLDANTTIDLAVLPRLEKLIEPELLTELESIRQEIGKKVNVPRDLARRRNAAIGRLRQHLATACIELLEPDLIILDEFQRFKPLLERQGEAGELAHQLFDYVGHGAESRLVLLSATPYRMYGSSDDGSEEHYSDFLATMEFLLQSPSKIADLKALLAEFRQRLLQAPVEGLEPLIASSAKIGEVLRSVISRMERIGAAEDASGMLSEVDCRDIALHPSEVGSYRGLLEISKLLGVADPMEYWKSAPQALSFMEAYQLRHRLDKWIEEDETEAGAVLGAHRSMMVDVKRAAQLIPLDPANGKVEWLLDRTVRAGMWRCLWLPPAMPYYPTQGPFADLPESIRTKQLVFSAWQLVPRALAATLSHTAETAALGALGNSVSGESIEDIRNRSGGLLTLTARDGKPERMTRASLLYPSVVLARAVDPLVGEGCDRGDLETTKAAAGVRIRQRIDALEIQWPVDGKPDTAAYWAIPILLDRIESRLQAVEGLEAALRAEQESPRQSSGTQSHLQAMIEVARNGWRPSGPPPKYLIEVLTLACLGNPAVVSLRALSRVVGWDVAASRQGRAVAIGLASEFRNLYNLPEVTGIIQHCTSSEQPYWVRCLDYATQGCLQAVMDEFAHVAVEDEGVQSAEPAERLEGVASRISKAIGLRRASVTAHEWRVGKNGKAKAASHQIATRFAVRFGEEKAEDADGERMRADDVRASFNSPFWPFVLITTSVGQEGLDFHWYAHSVIHWNLPNNPVDLEQREGRVHRFKGHAIRRNVARRWGAKALAAGAVDPWTDAFVRACNDRSTADCDLVPFWVYPTEGGARVERHVPVYPLSRDAVRLERLRKALVLYRMVFGQARQEELMGFLERSVSAEELARVGASLRIDLSPPLASK